MMCVALLALLAKRVKLDSASKRIGDCVLDLGIVCCLCGHSNGNQPIDSYLDVVEEHAYQQRRVLAFATFV